MHTGMFKKRVSAALVATALAAGYAASAQAYGLVDPWKIKFSNFEVITPEPAAVGTPVLGSVVTSFANTVEDNWAVAQLTEVRKDTLSNDLIWSDGDGGQHLYAIFWGLATTDTISSDTTGDGIADVFRPFNAAATTFTGGVTAVPDLDADGASDVGFAIYMRTGSDIFDSSLGPIARDVSAAALTDGIPDYPNVTFYDANSNGVKDGGETDLALQALFKLDTGIAAAAPGGSGILPVTTGEGDSTTVPLSGKGEGYGDLLNKDLSGLYDGSVPYGSPFDGMIQGAFGPLVGGVFRDMRLSFSITPDTTLTWDAISEDPIRGRVLPEPTTLALLGIGLLGYAGARYRRGAR